MATKDKTFEQKALRAVNAVVFGELEDAFAAFQSNPGGDAFGRLERAMWASQMIAQDFGKKFILDTLCDVPVAQWLDAIESESKKHRNMIMERSPKKEPLLAALKVVTHGTIHREHFKARDPKAFQQMVRAVHAYDGTLADLSDDALL